MFSVTSAAAREVIEAAARSDAQGLALRVAARRENDGSIAYGMGFDEVRSGDLPREFDGLTVLVAAGSDALLEGTVLDFVELEPGRFDFIFVPPAQAPGAAGP
ncbi:MAG: HesB/IscA family protein [Betaproteobacteria bacterium]